MRELYRKRIESLVKEYSNFKNSSLDAKQELDNLQVIVEGYQREINSITEDTSIKPSHKYELINVKLEEIEKVALKITKLYNYTTEKFNKLNKDRDVLVKTCIEDNPELTQEDVLNVIVKLLEKEGI